MTRRNGGDRPPEDKITTESRTSSFYRLLGVALLIVPFVPLRRLFGPLEGAEALVPPTEWMLGVAIFVVSAWVVAFLAGHRLPSGAAAVAWLDTGKDRTWACVLVAVVAAALVTASLFAFRRSPHLIDSIVQLFQAKIFASGSLAAPTPPRGGFFVTQHMIADSTGWYAQYPPGHAALLAAGELWGAPWLVPVFLSVGTALLLYRFSTRIWGRRSGRLTLLLAALSPFLWFMGASFMNHVSTLFFVSVFLFLFARWEESGGIGWAVCAGGALGAAALSRPLTAVAVAAPFAAFALATEKRRFAGEIVGTERVRDARAGAESGREARSPGPTDLRNRLLEKLQGVGPVVVGAVGFAAVASLYLVFNARVTGDPFLPGYLKLWGEGHGLGFHATPWGGEHTFVDGLRNELVDLSLLNLFLFEWPVPAMVPVGGVFALGWMGRRWDRRLLLAFLAVPSAYFFYWHRDAFLGPRFLYAGLAFLLPLTARSLVVAAERLPEYSFRVGDLLRPVPIDRWAMVFLVLCLGYGALYGTPQRFRVYASGMPSMKADIREDARESGIERALIYVKVSWGNRMLARLRGLGLSAGLTVRAYRSVGHCELYHLLERAGAEEWETGVLSRRIRDRIQERDSLVRRPRLNGDRTLKVRHGSTLTDPCLREIRYDRRGFTNYTPHLVANAPDLSSPLVVARDLRSLNSRLMRRFSDRPRYLYWDGEFHRIETKRVAGRPKSRGLHRSGATGRSTAPRNNLGVTAPRTP